MAIEPTIYDWPQSVIPRDQLLRVPGQATMGGFTTGGARLMSPEVGGRAVMKWTFDTQIANSSAPRLYSWLLSQVGKGTIFCLKMWNSRQLVSAADLGLTVPAGYDSRGIPWDGNILWDNLMGWEFDPGAVAVGAGLEGASTIVIDFGDLLPGLLHGHAIGIAGRAYIVDDIEYVGSIATVTITPPLRADTIDGDFVSFRPSMYGVCTNPSEFEALFDQGQWVRPGNITFAEAII